MKKKLYLYFIFLLTLLLSTTSCSQSQRISELSDLNGKIIGITRDVISTNRVLTIFPEAEIRHFDSIEEAFLELKEKNIDAILDDIIVLRVIQSQNKRYRILDDTVANISYGFAVSRNNVLLRERIDRLIDIYLLSGLIDDMINRWIYDDEKPPKLPDFTLNPVNGRLRFGTTTENDIFSSIDDDGKIIGFDVELAYHLAQSLEMGLEIINTQPGALIPLLQANRVDMIGGGLTITEDRQRRVLFAEPYFESQIGVMVR